MPSSSQNLNFLRAIDANANRCQEALRVIEDCLRFVLGDQHLAKLTKNLRHDLAKQLAQESHARVDRRDADGDVGRHTQLDTEYRRTSTKDLLQANFARAQQSMRCLEEFFKLVDGECSKRFEQLRYEIYSLEKAAVTTYLSIDQLQNVRLYVLSDAANNKDEFQTRIEKLIAGGADAIQLRDKQLDDRTLLTRARILVQNCRQAGVLSIINDRADLAGLAGADGVHLGQDDLEVSDARRLLGVESIVGVSSHSIEQARIAAKSGANYLGVGPTFSSNTKQFEQLCGTPLLRQVAGEIALPAFAIGGINADNVDQVLLSGISRIAVSRAALFDDSRIEQITRELKDRLESTSALS